MLRTRTVKENTRTEERMENDEVGKRAVTVDHVVKGKPLWKGNISAKTWSANQRQHGSEQAGRFRGGSQVRGQRREGVWLEGVERGPGGRREVAWGAWRGGGLKMKRGGRPACEAPRAGGEEQSIGLRHL